MTNTFTNNPERRDLQIYDIESRRYIVNLARNKAKVMLSYDFPGIEVSREVEYDPVAITHTKHLTEEVKVVTMLNHHEQAEDQAYNQRIDQAQQAVLAAHNLQPDVTRENLEGNQYGFPV